MFVGIGFASSDQDEMVVHLLGLGFARSNQDKVMGHLLGLGLEVRGAQFYFLLGLGL